MPGTGRVPSGLMDDLDRLNNRLKGPVTDEERRQIAEQKLYALKGFAEAAFGMVNAVQKVITGTNPAAGVECSDAVTSGKVWYLLGYNLTCVQGLTQTPLVSLSVNGALYPGTSSAINASTTCAMTWRAGLPLTAGGAATTATAPLQETWVISGSIATSTSGIGANTDHGAPTITVIEFS